MVLSVIIPVYNCEKYIEKCIESVLELVNEKIELIIIDDGSTDSSGKLCDSYQQDNVLVFHKENGGVSAARNYGITKARGDYITFFDGDDYILAEHLKKAIGLIESQHAEMFVFNHYKEKEGGITRANYSFFNNLMGICEKQDIYSHVYSQKLPVSTVWSLVIQRGIIVDNNIKFDTTMKMSEDILFVTRCLEKINNIYISNLAYYVHYYNMQSVCNNAKSEYLDNFCMMREELIKLAKKNNHYEKYKGRIEDVILGQVIRTCAKIYRNGENSKEVYYRLESLGYYDVLKKMQCTDIKHWICQMLLKYKMTYMIKWFIH